MTQNKKKEKVTKNEKPLSGLMVQYSPRSQSGWVLADYGGKDFPSSLIWDHITSHLSIYVVMNC